MNEAHVIQISDELKLTYEQIKAVALFLEEGATIPFIARYRKEATGSLDETFVTLIRNRLSQLEELDQRKQAILKSLEQNGHLTDELKEKILTSETMSLLEDIYLPYRPKRRTRGMAAREKGLEPLALAIFEQQGINPYEAAKDFLDPEKEIFEEEHALSGARDIIAEIINEDLNARAKLRLLFAEKSIIQSKVSAGKETEGIKYKDYFDWQEPVFDVASHRLLAMRRGEKEDILNLTISPPEEMAITILEDLFVIGNGEDSAQVKMAVSDAYKRLLSRSMETEIRMETKQKADSEAIRVFALNLRELLLASPLGAKRIMGIDPGFRTGCKVVCMDRQGKLLHH